MYCTLPDRRVYYQTLGEGPDLVMLHGWGQDVSSFWGVAETLSHHFKVWLVDLPGFGRSELGAEPLTVSDYADIVAQLLQSLDLVRPAVLGHSFGGRVAIKLAACYSELVGRLVLEDAPARPAKRTLKSRFYYVVAKVLKYLMPNLFQLRTRLQHRFYRAIGSDYFDAGPLRQTLVNVVNEDLSDDLARIDAETLLIWGEQDPSVPLREGLAIYQMVPKARIEVIERAGHFPHLENPRLFTHYVAHFC